jgi:FkbM family methyltransferase
MTDLQALSTTTGLAISHRRARYGDVAYFSNDTPIGESIREYGEWAQVELEFLRQFLPAGGCAVDVGANIGSHTLAFSDFVGPSGTVYAFEPHRQIFPVLERNTRANDLRNVVVKHAGVGNKADQAYSVKLAADSRIDSSSAKLQGVSSTGSQPSVPIVRLDEHDFKRCDLIKIDILDGVTEAVAGMEGILAQFKPVLFIRCDVAGLFDDVQALYDWAGWNFNLIRTATFNPQNILANPHNLLGHGRETSLLISPIEVEIPSSFRQGIDVVPITNSLQLAALLDSTPSANDEHLFEKNWQLLQDRVTFLQLRQESLEFAIESLQADAGSRRQAQELRELNTEVLQLRRRLYLVEQSRGWRIVRKVSDIAYRMRLTLLGKKRG